MTKLNKKEIENQLRGKLAKQYTERVKYLENEVEQLHKKLQDAYKRAQEAEREKLEMKDKLNQYEDWNNRLQEFMDMNDSDRVKYVENLRKNNELDALLKKFGFFDKMLSRVFI